MTEGPSARVIRALSSDQRIRVAAVDASALWDGVRRGHPHLDAEACACLTEFLAATALLNSRTLFLERLQFFLRGAGRARALVSDCWLDGTLRGVLDLGKSEDGWIRAPGHFKVMRSDPGGQPYMGTLDLVDGPIHAQVEQYLQQSEQVMASITLWCDPATGHAGGLLVEPLPDCPPARLKRLLQAIEGVEVLQDSERVPAFLVDWVNGGPGAEHLGVFDLLYRCRCTRASLLGTLRGFPREQVLDLFDETPHAEVRCDYCGATYLFRKQEILDEAV
ncbi:MAG: Hsp33 family molecular chaperone HslO [Acidobacteria bacterium]|nr:Hsp33 family molecular chaperone HslO [Acidobacteriota bacterium]